MTSLKDKVQNGLDEARTLILGAQVLLGFQYNGVFQPGFGELPRSTQYLKLVGLLLMLITLMLLMSPAPFHRLAERGHDSVRVQSYTSRVMVIALIPFALGLGIDFYSMAQQVAGRAAAIAIGTAIVAIALFFWYGLEAVASTIREPLTEKAGMARADRIDKVEHAELSDRIRHVLTEARVVLPGAQALLGFQLIAMLTSQFATLPEPSKYVHLVSLVLIGLSTIILMSPAAYHRIVEHGENTERFERYAGTMVLAAMVPLALGICGDTYVVTNKILVSPGIAAALAVLMFVLFQTLWFAVPMYLRRRTHRAS